MSRNTAKAMDSNGHENSENKGSAKVDTSEPNDPLPPMPKRFLSAYNYFFMTERAAFLETEAKKQASSHTGLPLVTSAPFALDDPFTGRAQRKRKHVKSHGKIGFKKLSQRIVRMWKQISPEEKEIYEKLAKDDLQRYRREMKEYEKKMREISYKQKIDNKKEGGLSSKMNEETRMCEGNSEMKESRKSSGCAAVSVGEKPVVDGGWDKNGNCSSPCEEYDTSEQQWSSTTSMQSNRLGCADVSVERPLCAIGGYDGSNYHSSMESLEMGSPSPSLQIPLAQQYLASEPLPEIAASQAYQTSQVQQLPQTMQLLQDKIPTGNFISVATAVAAAAGQSTISFSLASRLEVLEEALNLKNKVSGTKKRVEALEIDVFDQLQIGTLKERILRLEVEVLY